MSDVFRDRIKSLRRVKAADLVANSKNWRRHPETQRGAMSAALAEIGLADALLVRETEQGLEIIDGHLRANLCADQKVPVLVLDVTAEEADKLLATFDPLTSMAEVDLEALASLAEDMEFDNSELDEMLAGLTSSLANTEFNAEAEWVGMPAFTQGDLTAWKSINVHFTSAEDMEAFAKLVGQSMTPKTRFIWFPKAEIGHFKHKRFAANES